MFNLTVGFSKPKNNKFPIFSWAIRLVDRTPYSHVYISWKSDSLERTLIYEASGSMVHFLSGERFNKKAKVLYEYEFEISNELRKKLLQKAVDYAGASYGIKQIFGIVLVKIFRALGRDIKNPFSDGKATWVCSELVSDLLKEIGMDIGIHQDNVTPKDIQQYLEKIYG